MLVLGLRAEDIRNLRRFNIAPSPGVNLFHGPNAGGKTTVLEALYLLGHSRSFRSSDITKVVHHGGRSLRISAELRGRKHGSISLGVERGRGLTRIRCNGETLTRTTEQARLVKFCLVTPASHALIEGSSQERRRWLDWGMFHVEPSYLEPWRKYYSALRQRNSLLRSDAPDREFLPWEKTMQEAAVELRAGREEYLQRMCEALYELSQKLLFLPLRFEIMHGWDRGRLLLDQLEAERPKDREVGFTRHGPHRLEISPMDEQGAKLLQISRGQQKLLALAMNMAQAGIFLEKTADIPIFLIDDLASELDSNAVSRALSLLAGTQAQVFITTTQLAQVPLDDWKERALFHVEQGKISQNRIK